MVSTFTSIGFSRVHDTTPAIVLRNVQSEAEARNNCSEIAQMKIGPLQIGYYDASRIVHGRDLENQA